MSESLIESRLISRPEFQRTELGPVLHAYGHEIFDALEPKIPIISQSALRRVTESKGKNWNTNTGVLLLGSTISRTLFNNEVINSDDEDNTVIDFSKSVMNIAGKRLIDRYNSKIHSELGYTHYKDFMNVVVEGFTSGIVMPLQIWRLIDYRENGFVELNKQNITEWKQQKQNFQRVAQILSETRVQEMLNFLSFSYNGSLSDFSTDLFINLVDAERFNGLISIPRPIDLDTDEAGRVKGFTSDYKKRYLESIKDSNFTWRNGNRNLYNPLKFGSAESGGCPVRHSTFKKLGKVATEIFNEHPEYIEYLKRDETLIARASLFIASTLEHASSL